MKNLKAVIKCALIIAALGFSAEKIQAQKLLLDPPNLERTVYENQQKRLKPFDGILEKHVYKIKTDISGKSRENLIAEIKKNTHVSTVNTEDDAIVVWVNKNEMKDASYLLSPAFESQKIPILSHYVLFYLKDNQ
jgi:hypothetical protein